MKTLFGDFYGPIITAVRIIGIVIVSLILIKVGSRTIKKIFERQKKLRIRVNDQKIDTMATLVSSTFRYAVYVLAGVNILTEIGVLEPGSLLAAAGIGGIIVGLGSQSLIKDVLSGLFIILEEQYAVGDMITIDNMTGFVEELELRVTRIRNFNGDLYIIPNGEIKKVINHVKRNKAAIVDIPVAYSSDVNKAFEIANRVCEIVAKEFDTVIVEGPSILGITELGKENMNIRVIASTIPNRQWEVERRIRKLIIEGFSKADILFYDKNRIITDDRSVKGGM